MPTKNAIETEIEIGTGTVIEIEIESAIRKEIETRNASERRNDRGKNAWKSGKNKWTNRAAQGRKVSYCAVFSVPG